MTTLLQSTNQTVSVYEKKKTHTLLQSTNQTVSGYEKQNPQICINNNVRAKKQFKPVKNKRTKGEKTRTSDLRPCLFFCLNNKTYDFSGKSRKPIS